MEDEITEYLSTKYKFRRTLLNGGILAKALHNGAKPCNAKCYKASLNPNVPFIEEAGIPERLDTRQASHLEAALPPLMTRISPGSLT